MNIIITPFNVSSNQYINITKNAFLSLGYNVSSIRLSLIVSRKNNIFICNWIEDHIAGRGLKPIKGFLHAIMIIAFGKIAAKNSFG
ncbi:hypothetical protein [Sodalis ligni]|uniref:hypothetical protein n=1 Tax=Sodalis ligni TaxID=2697027 RepID=UPI001049C7A4|nr:hypothetical protein [Sodalis ligni]